jgi:molecular chaperone DnaK (HSP70)
VKSIDGDGALGGRDFDQALYEYCVERIQQIYNRNLRTNAANNKKAREKLRKKCEITKSNLSFSPEDR